MRLSFRRKLLVLLAALVAGAIHAKIITDNLDARADLLGGFILGCLTLFFVLTRDRLKLQPVAIWLITTTFSYITAVNIASYISLGSVMASYDYSLFTAMTWGGLVGAVILSIGYTVTVGNTTAVQVFVTTLAGGALAFSFAILSLAEPKDTFFPLPGPSFDINPLLFIIWPTVIMAMLLFWPNQKKQRSQVPK